jgi:hypothetical protein
MTTQNVVPTDLQLQLEELTSAFEENTKLYYAGQPRLRWANLTNGINLI